MIDEAQVQELVTAIKQWARDIDDSLLEILEFSRIDHPADMSVTMMLRVAPRLRSRRKPNATSDSS